MSKQAMQKALDVLRGCLEHHDADDAIAELTAALEVPDAEPTTKENSPGYIPWFDAILGAVARGWCDKPNAHKEMDATLALSIAKEVQQVFQPVPAKLPDAEPVDERALFEKWVADHTLIPEVLAQVLRRVLEDKGKPYMLQTTYAAYEAWKARATIHAN